jgi:hypothetical protein
MKSREILFWVARIFSTSWKTFMKIEFYEFINHFSEPQSRQVEKMYISTTELLFKECVM